MASSAGLTGIFAHLDYELAWKICGTLLKVYKLALDAYACSLILCHNHPSGNITPSEADTAITKKLVGAGVMLDITVLDHIIVGNNEYFSYADNGLL